MTLADLALSLSVHFYNPLNCVTLPISRNIQFLRIRVLIMASGIRRSFVARNYISRLTAPTKCRPLMGLSFPLSSSQLSSFSPLGPTRRFSASTRNAKAMAGGDFKALKVRQDRLMDTLHSTCVFGPGERWGK